MTQIGALWPVVRPILRQDAPVLLAILAVLLVAVLG